MHQEYRRAVRAVLFKRFDIAEAAVLIYRSILIELFPSASPTWHTFDMDRLPAFVLCFLECSH